MTIEQLIEVLKVDGKSVYVVLEDWFNKLLDTVESEILEERYNIIYGFIWGLSTIEYITDSEVEQLKSNLLELYRKRLYEIY